MDPGSKCAAPAHKVAAPVDRSTDGIRIPRPAPQPDLPHRLGDDGLVLPLSTARPTGEPVPPVLLPAWRDRICSQLSSSCVIPPRSGTTPRRRLSAPGLQEQPKSGSRVCALRGHAAKDRGIFPASECRRMLWLI